MGESYQERVFRSFTQEPLRDAGGVWKPVEDVPGIGHDVAEALRRDGCGHASNLVGMYLTYLDNKAEFRHFLRDHGVRDDRWLDVIVRALMEWVDIHT